MKVSEITPDTRAIEVTVAVVEKVGQRDVNTKDGQPHQVAEFLVGDESGCILFSLWDDKIESVEIGRSYILKGGYVNVFKNSMRLNIGKQGEMTSAAVEVKPNTSVNISDKHVEAPARFGGGFGGQGRSFPRRF